MRLITFSLPRNPRCSYSTIPFPFVPLPQDQMQIAKFMPEVALSQRLTIRNLEMLYSSQSLQHSQMGRARLVQASEHSVHGTYPPLGSHNQLCPTFAWMGHPCLIGHRFKGAHNRRADRDDPFPL